MNHEFLSFHRLRLIYKKIFNFSKHYGEKHEQKKHFFHPAFL